MTRTIPRGTRSLSALFACRVAGAARIIGGRRGTDRAHRTFATPEDAVKALVDAVKAGERRRAAGDLRSRRPGADRVIRSRDRAHEPPGVHGRRREQWRLEDAAPGRKTLVVGHEDWPFPVPLVKEAGGLAVRHRRRQGRSAGAADRTQRAAAIATSRAYVTAQQRYAQQGHDGKPAGLYATKFSSDPGKENGLYWPTARGQKRSPLGDLVAQAADEGRPLGADRRSRRRFHGYYFKILTGQGAAAPVEPGAIVVKGEMSGGFALVAWPAQYDVTGVMTFIVNQDGIVRQRDLGPQTDAIARKMTVYNPDAAWRQVQ